MEKRRALREGEVASLEELDAKVLERLNDHVKRMSNIMEKGGELTDPTEIIILNLEDLLKRQVEEGMRKEEAEEEHRAAMGRLQKLLEDIAKDRAEIKRASGESERITSEAKAAAEAAKVSADGAKTIAGEAKTAATEAKTAAQGAKASSDDAKKAADGAKSAADAAKADVNSRANEMKAQQAAISDVNLVGFATVSMIVIIMITLDMGLNLYLRS